MTTLFDFSIQQDDQLQIFHIHTKYQNFHFENPIIINTENIKVF